MLWEAYRDVRHLNLLKCLPLRCFARLLGQVMALVVEPSRDLLWYRITPFAPFFLGHVAARALVTEWAEPRIIQLSDWKSVTVGYRLDGSDFALEANCLRSVP